MTTPSPLSAASKHAVRLPVVKKPRGLFLNTPVANCSIYESGRMAYQSLLLSVRYQLDYLEIDVNARQVPQGYDFYIFNYHYGVMHWLDTKCLRALPGLKLTIVLETRPNDPLVLCPDDFDAYLVIDPVMNVADKRIYAFPRPLEVHDLTKPYRESAIPIIGSFGLGTPGKGFELVVDAVNREFDEAIVRINVPPGTHSDHATWKFYKRDYGDYLTELCKRVAKKGIEVVVTRDYMTKEGLIEWCGENTLNCFLYNRNQPGLAATTDQAVSSGRALAISTNETFRHIHPYLKPYPFQSLRESIASSQPQVLQMQEDWSPENFAGKFECLLADFDLFSEREQVKIREDSNRNSGPFQLATWQGPNLLASTLLKIRSTLKLRTRVKQLLGVETNQLLIPGSEDYFGADPLSKTEQLEFPQSKSPIKITGQPKENTILIINHKEKNCGMQQYGVNITEALQKSLRYAFAYAECSSEEELHQAVLQTSPSAIIYNYHWHTFPWLSNQTTRRYTIPQLGMMHEVTQEEADKATQELFDYYLCPDPTLAENNPNIFKTRRLIPSYINYKFVPEVVTIGTFGFGSDGKGFERVIHTVQHEFDEARIVINIPPNDFMPKNLQDDVMARINFSRQRLIKPGIEVVVTRDFLTKRQLLDFLAANTLNAFFYNPHKDLGISSTIEHALAVQRPVAITKCRMFRHVYSASPSICIEDTSLKQIIDNGIAPLVPFYNEWSEASFILGYENILDRVFARTQKARHAGFQPHLVAS